jgi:tetraacyldisaccharide-1-P 4'-kinase
VSADKALDAGDSYSAVATEQLDALEAGDDPVLYNAVLEACELVSSQPDRAQSLSAAITTKEGIRFRLAVDGHHPYKVFWFSEGPRIEALFPYP